MDFSDVLAGQTLAQWSPNAKYVAAADKNRVQVREPDSLKLVQVYICIDKVERIEWSPDSQFLLTEVARQGLLQIWSLRDSEWTCRIYEGLAGIAHARWGPGTDRVLVAVDFQLYLSIWPLQEGASAVQIRYPKFPRRGFAFSRDACWLAVLRRKDCKDRLGIYNSEESFSRLTDVAIAGDASDLAWAPDDNTLLVWERAASSPWCRMYSLAGECLAQVGDALPRSVAPSPSMQLLAALGLDGQLQLLSAVSRHILTNLPHSLVEAIMQRDDGEVFLWEEYVELADGSPDAKRGYNRMQDSASFLEEKPVPEALDAEGIPKQGITLAAWSPDEHFLATKHESFPCAIWIWDLGRLVLHSVLRQRNTVVALAWDPTARGARNRLAGSTTDASLLLWTPRATTLTAAPMVAGKLRWRSDGRSLLLQEKDRFCVCRVGLPALEKGPLQESRDVMKQFSAVFGYGQQGPWISNPNTVTRSMDESLTSDLDSDSETECRALVGETGRRSDHGCCCGLCCKVCVLLSLCALVAGAVFHEALVARLASIGIAAAHIQFESVDVGTIRNSQTLSPRILASVSNPSPVNADVRMSRLVLKVPIFPSGTLARVGTVTMPSLRVQAFQDLQINISAHVHIEDLDVFGLAGKHAVREPDSSWVVEGKLQVRCELPFFAAHLSDIPFERQVALKGMASFSQDANPVTMEAITSAYGYPDHLDTTVAINIYNPSYLSAHLDTPTHFNITQRGHPFGTAVVQEVTLKPGRNTVSVRFLLHDDSSNREAVREFILGYIRADMQMVTMHGTERSCSDPLLAVVLDGLDLRFHFKPPAARFIHHITANLGLIGLQVTAEVANPLPQKIEIGGTDLSVRENTVEGEQIFRLKGDQDSGLGGQVLQPSAISALKLSLSTLDADLKDPLLIARLIEDAVDGAVVVGVSGPLSLTIAPNFTLTLNYIANNVTASLTCLLVCGSSHSLLNPVNWFPNEG
ncbi:WRAP73 [Symbiodinium sp. CCMP2456]|nr:WRAP73 [Symbiodinium sp. CCMP2456]